MKRANALKLVHELARFKDENCKKRDPRGFYVRQQFFPIWATTDEKRAVKARIGVRERTIWVRLDKLKSTQGCLGRYRLAYQIRRHPLKKLPTVIAMGRGKYLIWDGNHRATSAILLGKSRIKCTELYAGKKKTLRGK
jgi:hypothetical protein